MKCEQSILEDWLAAPQVPYEFDAEGFRPPTRFPLVRRDRIITFADHFRSPATCGSNLVHDIDLLQNLDFGICGYGACDIPVRPFVCLVHDNHCQLNAGQILDALNASCFRSEHISCLERFEIPYPGYQPLTQNDEIHTRFPEQYIFPHDYEREDGEREPLDENAGLHGTLKQSVVDGRLWYVLLHTADAEQAGDFVLLFAVGQSLRGNRLIGTITYQACHNLCD